MEFLTLGCSLLLGMILLLVSDTSEGVMRAITLDPGTIVIIKRKDPGSNCTVCVSQVPKPTCTSAGSTKILSSASVDFQCPQPQDIFSVEVNKEIDCIASPCPAEIAQTQSSLFPEFNRTFTWDLKIVLGKAAQLDLSRQGMRQIPPTDRCPDQHTYTLVSYQRSGPATIGSFCRNGTVSSVQVLQKTRLSLEIPGQRVLEPSSFMVSMAPEIMSLAVVIVELPSGVSTTELFSPNYPGGFPDDDLMTWSFLVPPMHNSTVKFLKQTSPRCMKKAVAVIYDKEGEASSVTKTLTDPQRTNREGSFNMSLENCEVAPNAPGLSLHFLISVFRSSHPVLCTVDLEKEEGLTLQIKKTDSKSPCEMKLNADVQDEITVLPGMKSSLSFQDCRSEELLLTASKNIECLQWETCPKDGIQLTFPTLEKCLPTPLRSVTWNLRTSEQGTVELSPPTGGIRQLLPGQECAGSFSLAVAEDQGLPVGHFCPDGAVRKVQVQANVSVVAARTGSVDLRQAPTSFFNLSFGKKITERYLFTVSPSAGSPVLLGTPNWPGGMVPNSSASWVVSMPPENDAEVLFQNVSQPSCGGGNTCIKVQTLDPWSELIGCRENEPAPGVLTVPQSFRVTLSNCLPEQGDFSVLTKITLLKKNTGALLGIILGTVGALLLVVLVLVVVCVVTRKRKRTVGKVSIYNPGRNVFLPGETKYLANETGIYDSIDDTLVYGHLLKESPGSGVGQDRLQGLPQDMYGTIARPAAGEPLSQGITADSGPGDGSETEGFQLSLDPSQARFPGLPLAGFPGRKDSLAYVDRRIVNNELNTFKSNGLSGLSAVTSLTPRLQLEQDMEMEMEMEQDMEMDRETDSEWDADSESEQQ